MNLKGLRLNCWLAPTVTALLGVAACLGLGLHLSTRLAMRALDDCRDALTAYARLEERGCRPPLAAWTTADPRWLGALEARLDGDRWETIAQAGGDWRLCPDDPPPTLVLAAHAPQAWSDAQGQRFAAVAIRPTGADRPVFVIAWAAPAHLGWAPTALGACAGLLLAGLLLGWYLTSRIWRTVESLDRYAQAALDDAPEPPLATAAETGDLRSSITSLARSYRSSRKPPE